MGHQFLLLGHFESKEPTVLISPSLNTGIDLRDDRARFAIIVKVPYPSKGDRWTDVRRERDSAWYNWLTGLKLVQAYGRTCRNKDDWAITYILDSAFTGFVRRNRMPKWFIEAIK